MGKVIAGFSMSLDGFVAASDDSVPTVIESDRVTHLVYTVRKEAS